MRKIKFLCVMIVAMTVVVVNAREPKKKYGAYIAAVSASFTDSLIYVSDIQYVDSASISGKMLDYRSQYSAQFKDYLETKEGGVNRTCFVFFGKKTKPVQKNVTKLKAKYKKSKTLVVKEVPLEKFKFSKPEIY